MSDARRAMVWLLALVAVVIAGDHLLAVVLHEVLVRSHFRYSRLYRGDNAADILILGDSRGVHSFYAPAIEEMTGLRVMNLSYNSVAPNIAEALLLDYLERNRAPRMVIIEPTCVMGPGKVRTELRTYAGLSPRLAALYAEEHPFAAAAGRIFWLFPLNSEFFLEALHYMRRTDQDWIYHDVMPPALRARQEEWRLGPLLPHQIEALARIVRLLRERGIEVRLVLAPYAPSKLPANAPEFVQLIARRTGEPVWNYVGAVDDPDSFFDTVHLNERGSRELLKMLHRAGFFGMAQPAR